MAIIGQTQGLTIPAVGTAGTTYATQINAALEAIEDVLETKITPASLNMNQTLSMANNAIENAAYVGVAEYGTDPSIAGALYMLNDDLWFKNGDSAPVQITSGSNLSLTSAGAIGGNYSDAGSVAEVKYLYASTDYYFFSNASSNLVANLVAGGLTFTSELAAGYPYSVAATTFTRATGGSSYTATWPNAAPAGKRLVQIDNAGDVTYENDIDGGLTVNDSGLTVTLGGLTVSAGGAAITGNSSVTGTLTSSGALTVSSGGAGITGNVTVTGSLSGTSSISTSGGNISFAGGERYVFYPVGCATQAAARGASNEGMLVPGSGGRPYRTMADFTTSEGFSLLFPLTGLLDGTVITAVHVLYSTTSGGHAVVGRIIGTNSPTTAVTDSSIASTSGAVAVLEQDHNFTIISGTSSLTLCQLPYYSIYHSAGTAGNFNIFGIAVEITAG